MAARTFADSAGAVWEVFEVHRSSKNPGAVSGGLERGWLAFTNGELKRRLAPFPAGWETAPDPELERLCSTARMVSPAKNPFDPTTRDRRRKERASATTLAAAPSAPAEGNNDAVEAAVREFARQARASGLAAIDAMVQLKGLLQEKFASPDSGARDLRLIRRWFVEAYYFERKL